MDLDMEPVVALLPPGASRSESAAFKKAVEDALHRLGWLLVDVSALDAPGSPGATSALLQDVHTEASRTFALPEDVLDQLSHERAAETGCQGLSYLPLGSEPLYSEGHAQRVRSLNAHLPLTQSECDARLPAATDAADRHLAHQYHRWPDFLGGDEGASDVKGRLLAERVHGLQQASQATAVLLREGVCWQVLEAAATSLVRPPRAVRSRPHTVAQSWPASPWTRCGVPRLPARRAWGRRRS